MGIGTCRGARAAAIAALTTVVATVAVAAVSDRRSTNYDGQSEIGQRVYAAKKCDRCHMIAGKGNMRFPLDRVGARLTETELRRWLTDTAEMEAALPRQPAVRMSEWLASNRRISAPDVAALVAYLATLK